MSYSARSNSTECVGKSVTSVVRPLRCQHTDLQSMFATEYCASLGMSRQAPLRVIGDIGGGGALARIEKGRKVMRERKSEWSQSDELPVSQSCSI